MSEGTISTEIKHFLREHIHSVEQLEVLLLLHGKPQKEWNATEISEELRIDPISSSNRLLDLSLRGIIEHQPGAGKLYNYRYRPSRPLEKVIDELAARYADSRLSIISLITSFHQNELLSLADAFKFKKDKKDG